MKKGLVKSAALALLSGGMLLNGCLSLDGFWGRTLIAAGIAVGTDFLTDNDGIFDLFEDGAETAATE